MDDILNGIKFNLSELLLKQGSSLEEFEKELAAGNTEAIADKLASVLTKKAFMEPIYNATGALITEGLPALAAGSLAAGTGLGGLLYGMDSHVTAQNKRLAEKEEELNRMRGITSRLRADYNLG